jgi:hypothetical protein
MQYYEMVKKRKAAQQNTPGTTPSTATAIGDYNQWRQNAQELNTSRIPQGAELEASSSAAIQSLLNPTGVFGDTARMAAERSAAGGVSGSPAAFGTYLRMSDDERLKRMKLGQDMLTQAMGRYPEATPPPASDLFQTPDQSAQDEIERLKLQLERDKYENPPPGGSGVGSKKKYFSGIGPYADKFYNDQAPYWIGSPL